MKFTFKRTVLVVVLLSGMIIMVAVTIFLMRLDVFVNQDLYRYGLQFNPEWAEQYWRYIRSALGFLSIFAAVNTFGLTYLLLAKHIDVPSVIPSEKTKPQRLARPLKRIRVGRKLGLVLLVGGGAALLFGSISFQSEILVFSGLGLILWGGLFLYIKSDEYVKEALLYKTTYSSLAVIDKMIGDLKLRGAAVYLPPKYSKDLESCSIYIKKNKAKFSTVEDFQSHVRNRKAILIKPIGAELARFFEKSLKTPFVKMDLQTFQGKIPNVLIEDLEIADNVRIKFNDNEITVKLEDSVFAQLCRETRNLKNVYGSIGCPICSAFACALTETTNKPLVMNKEHVDGRSSISMRFNILEIAKDEHARV